MHHIDNGRGSGHVLLDEYASKKESIGQAFICQQYGRKGSLKYVYRILLLNKTSINNQDASGLLQVQAQTLTDTNGDDNVFEQPSSKKGKHRIINCIRKEGCSMIFDHSSLRSLSSLSDL